MVNALVNAVINTVLAKINKGKRFIQYRRSISFLDNVLNIFFNDTSHISEQFS